MGVLARAELLLQAKNYSGSGEWLDEAKSHNAQFGSASGADTNDPLFLGYTGSQYVYMPGIAANYVSTPDAAALDIVGDIWIAGRFAMTDWTPASDQTLIAKWEDTGDQRAYRLMVDTTGVLRLGWSTDGTAANVVEEDSTTAPTVTNGDKLWVAGTLDVSSGDVKFYVGGIEIIPVWTQLGTTVSGAGSTSIDAGTAVLEVGTDNTGTAQFFIGEVYNAQVENGYDEGVGTLQFDADFTNQTAVTEPFATFAEASSNAATVTFNRASTGVMLTVVDRPAMLLGTDDLFIVPDDAALDFGATDDYTIMAAFRTDSTVNNARVLQKRSTPGYILSLRSAENTYRFQQFDDAAQSTTVDTTTNLGDRLAHVWTAIRDTTDDDLQSFMDGVSDSSAVTDTTTGTMANANDFHIGALNAGTAHFDGEIHAIVVWGEALSDFDVAAATAELSAGGGGLLLLRVG